MAELRLTDPDDLLFFVRDEDSGESAPPGVEAVIESPQADAGVVLRLDGAAVVPLAHDGRPHQLAITLGP